MADGIIQVVVGYATPTWQQLIALPLPTGSTLEAAVRQAFPELDMHQHRVGIFGKLKTLDTVVREGDRIEVYRPLLADPKDARRRRAREV